ncbi:RadC family protein [Leptolyngbya sp. KIOST-1]|uniref:RadC family protein n=1 Tax=Leptolyngbya sp. KIOST-1 TaxID=1229172 RepID=UPI00055C1AD8|nr:DNA repair protein RadC [Leptolyngbya sp. KIOST-1]
MTYHVRVLDLPSSDRPRERLLSYGAKSLSTAELLAILLGTGQGPGKLSAVGLGQLILQEMGQNQRDPLTSLRDVSAHDLTTIDGVGPAKATTILAAIELGKRVLQAIPPEQTVVDDPAIAAAALSHDLMWQAQERFAVVLLDVRHRLMGTRVITIGTATETLAHPREIFKTVIRHGAVRCIVAHNHPSGNLEPSPDDLALTRQLLQGAQILAVPVLDHLIIGNGDFRSLRQTTQLWQETPQGV